MKSTAVSVGVTPQALNADLPNGTGLIVQARTGGKDLFVGGPDVTTATGIQVVAGASPLFIPLEADEIAYGCVSSGSGTFPVVICGDS